MEVSRLGASTACLPNLNLRDALSRLQELGFETIELIAFEGARHSQGAVPGIWLHKLSEKECMALRDSLRDFKNVAVHLPFIDLPLFSCDTEMARFCIELLRRSINGCAQIGATVGTLHIHRRHNYRFQEYRREVIDTLGSLGDFAAQAGILLGIETMFPPSVEDFTSLILDINHDHVGATVDVGHIKFYEELADARRQPSASDSISAYNDCLMEQVRLLGDKIVHFHLHDVRAEDWRDHRAVGRGIIDFHRLFQLLRQIDYRRAFSFELEEPDTITALVESKQHIERLMDEPRRK